MLYTVLKIWVRLGALIFCRKICINTRERLSMKGPLLIASNHPNSFLDAVLLDILFKKPLWSLTRGDVFKKKYIRKLLSKLNMIPVFRNSEGAENLELNYATFEQCKEIFRNKGIVLVFSEGNCINEWHLRALKKGTARLAISSWAEGIDLTVLPVGINYSSFRRFGKNVFIHFGSLITKESVKEDTEGKKLIAFNNQLRTELEKGVFEINGMDATGRERLMVPVSLAEKIILFFPALAGWVVNAPLYVLVQQLTRKIIEEREFHDSIINASLVLLYPFYVISITLLFFILTGNPWAWGLLALFPLTAWSFTRVNFQLDPG